MSQAPTDAPASADGRFERATVRPGRGLDGGSVPLEGIVDRVLDDHQAVMAALGDDLRVPIAGIPEGPASVLRREREALAALQQDLGATDALRSDLEARRRERARLVADLRPKSGPVLRDPPIVTRSGVLRVEADFTQAHGLTPVAESRLYEHGIRTVRAFLEASVDELVRVTGVAREAVQRAREDLRLERLAGLDGTPADLLRVAGVHAVSDLASRDPALLAKRLGEVRGRHHLARFPDILASERALADLIADARARSG